MSSKKPIAARLEEQRHRIFELGAIVKVVNQTLNGFSGDEDSLDIVEQLSTHTFALEGAYRLSNLVNEQLELIGREFEAPAEAESELPQINNKPAHMYAWIGRQRERIFQAQSLAHLVKVSLDREETSDKFHHEWTTLDNIIEILDEVAARLDRNAIYMAGGPSDNAY